MEYIDKMSALHRNCPISWMVNSLIYLSGGYIQVYKKKSSNKTQIPFKRNIILLKILTTGCIISKPASISAGALGFWWPRFLKRLYPYRSRPIVSQEL